MSERMKGKKLRTGSLGAFSEILPAVCKELELDRKVNELALLALWSTQAKAVLGEKIALQTQATRLQRQGQQTILWVKVSNATLASELSFHVEQLKNALNAFTPQTGLRVDQLQWRVGSLTR